MRAAPRTQARIGSRFKGGENLKKASGLWRTR
jgi:hypothetical protein